MISLIFRISFSLLVALNLTASAYAVDAPTERLSDPKMEARAEAIGKDLRCLVCQNESIEDSSSQLAQTLRKEVRAQITNNKSDAQIHQWMMQHYGDYIELSPPLSPKSIALWATPFMASVIAALILFQFKKRGE